MLHSLLQIGQNQRQAGAVVDTNLLVLLLVGRLDIRKIDYFRATAKYQVETYQYLETLVSYFPKVFCTTQIVTEVDNLSRQVRRVEWPGISSALRSLVATLQELQFGSDTLLANRQHAEFGVADCSVMELARRGPLVITDDLSLTVLLQKNRLPVLNLSRYLG